jgi:hypothetical protein
MEPYGFQLACSLQVPYGALWLLAGLWHGLDILDFIVYLCLWNISCTLSLYYASWFGYAKQTSRLTFRNLPFWSVNSLARAFGGGVAVNLHNSWGSCWAADVRQARPKLTRATVVARMVRRRFDVVVAVTEGLVVLLDLDLGGAGARLGGGRVGEAVQILQIVFR